MSVLERCPSYKESTKGSKQRQGPTLGVHFTEVSVKRESTVIILLSDSVTDFLKDCKWKEGRQCHYKVTAHPSVDDVLLIQGSGPHVDLAPVEKEVIVDLHCGAAVLRGADIFVPGVMAAHPGEFHQCSQQ